MTTCENCMYYSNVGVDCVLLAERRYPDEETCEDYEPRYKRYDCNDGGEDE